MNRRYGCLIVCVILIVIITLLTVSSPNVYITRKLLSVALADIPPPPSLHIKVNVSGTHIDQSGYLKVRLDFYPDIDDKSYSMQRVFAPVVPETGYPGIVDKYGTPVDMQDYVLWYECLPKQWVINPALSHFITVSPDITAEVLADTIKSVFNGNVTATIDDIVTKQNSAHLVTSYMCDKSILSTIKVTNNQSAIIQNINTRLDGLEIIADTGGIPQPVSSRSIDIGMAAIDRNDVTSQGVAHICKDNPANADGTVTSVEIWANYQLSGCEIAMFYLVSGTTFSTRSNTTIGTVSPGSKQTFSGLSLSVATGDYIGFYVTLGSIERSSSGGSGYWYKHGDYIPTTNTSFTDSGTTRIVSLYGTGTESGGCTPDIENTPSSNDFGVLTVTTASATAINRFTITNNSEGAVSITIQGTDMTGGDDTWTLSDTATPGNNIYGLEVGLDDDDDLFDVIVKKSAPYNTLVSGLADSGTQAWGLKLYMPSSVTDYEGQQMTATITLVATCD